LKAETAARAEVIRVLLVDDHSVVRQGIRLIIEEHAGLQVVGEARNRSETIAIAEREHPDVVLLDIDLGDESGLDFIPEILTASSGKAKVLVLTGVRDRDSIRSAVRRGAVGAVLKEQAGEALVKAIHKVHAGEVWLDRFMIASLLAEMSHVKNEPEASKIATLTKREREIIHLIGDCMKNKQIADRLFISETTVRHHLTSIFDKLGVTDRLELLVYSYKHGLISPPGHP
jgi:two-component system nitrate/nitrite response regulator NarL